MKTIVTVRVSTNPFAVRRRSRGSEHVVGSPFPFTGGTGDGAVPPDQIAAVEYYSPAETPSQFNMTGSACGTLIIWRKS